MLEKPKLPDDRIKAHMLNAYGLHVTQIEFLPIGADHNTAVYHLISDGSTSFFLKLRRGVFKEISVALPKYLSDQGIAQIIAPIPAQNDMLWTNMDAYKLILYAYIQGYNAYEVPLMDHHWRIFGTALKGIHTITVPEALLRYIRKERYSPQWRNITLAYLKYIEVDEFNDPVSAELAEFLRSEQDQILKLIRRTEKLAEALHKRALELVLCHSDLHAGNILLGVDDTLYLVDWDDPIMAPKERDLMYIGGGLVGAWIPPQEEENRFYQAYGQMQIDPIALAYYRYERIIEDIAVFCQEIFQSNTSGQNRKQSLIYLKSNFLPNGTIEIAYQTDRSHNGV